MRGPVAAELCPGGVQWGQLAGTAQSAATGVLRRLDGVCGCANEHREGVSSRFFVSTATGWD